MRYRKDHIVDPQLSTPELAVALLFRQLNLSASRFRDRWGDTIGDQIYAWVNSPAEYGARSVHHREPWLKHRTGKLYGDPLAQELYHRGRIYAEAHTPTPREWLDAYRYVCTFSDERHPSVTLPGVDQDVIDIIQAKAITAARAKAKYDLADVPDLS